VSAFEVRRYAEVTADRAGKKEFGYCSIDWRLQEQTLHHMKNFVRPVALVFTILLLTIVTSGQTPTRPDEGVLEPVLAKKDLYPTGVDANKEIDDALRQAMAEKKRVILIFGGNWCYDCHVLDRALHEGAAGKIVREKFLLVHVDIGEGNKNLDLLKKYHIPLEKGVPAVALLDPNGTNGPNGKLIYSSGDGEFEAARSMMKKDLVAFLTQWAK